MQARCGWFAPRRSPGAQAAESFTVTNVSGNTQTVNLSTRTLGPATSTTTGQVALNTATAPTYLDVSGTVRSYVAQKFTVAPGADRLDIALTSPSRINAARIVLIDPHGTYQTYSIPQGVGGYAHSDVHFPAFGTWTAYFVMSKSANFNGTLQYEVTTSNFTSHGTVSPATITLAPGATKAVTVRAPFAAQPGDLSASVQLSTPLGVTSSVPLTLRTLIPTSAKKQTFTGVITGGNGRGGTGATGQALGGRRSVMRTAGRR